MTVVQEVPQLQDGCVDPLTGKIEHFLEVLIATRRNRLVHSRNFTNGAISWSTVFIHRCLVVSMCAALYGRMGI